MDFFSGIVGGILAVNAYLQAFNTVSICFRLLLAMLLGGILGIERGRKKRPAGFRTYMSVCVGSALVMITSQYVTGILGGGGDPLRMGAQVISGIGFLGAGTIIVTGRNQVKGLTTAAGLWVAACIGLAVGVGFYEGGILCAGLLYFAMTVMHRVERNVLSHSRMLDCFAEFESMDALSGFIAALRARGISVVDLQINRHSSVDTDVGGVFSLKLAQSCAHSDVVHELAALAGVKYIEEIS